MTSVYYDNLIRTSRQRFLILENFLSIESGIFDKINRTSLEDEQISVSADENSETHGGKESEFL